eukprot:SAG11_NODE_2092_length_3841_cov_2.213789_6_plen_400_part_00
MAPCANAAAHRRLGRVGLELARGRPLKQAAALAGAQAPASEQLLRDKLAQLQQEQDRLTLELGARSAATDGDYLRVLPRSSAIEDTVAFFRENGFWVIPNAVSGDWLRQVQAAFTTAQGQARELWQAARDRRNAQNYSAGSTGIRVRDGEPADLGEARLGEELAGRHANGYFDVPRFVEQDDCLLRLLDNPKVVPVLEAVMGGKVQVNQIQARTVPAEVASQYTSWHRDAGDHVPIHPDFSSSIKVFTFFFDVPADGGCAAVVPGSHRVQYACNPFWKPSMDQEKIGKDGKPCEATGHPPSFIKFPCKAGTSVMYDNRIFHNALPNTSGYDRCCLITSYQPFGRSQSGQVVANAERLLAAGRLGEDRPMLRQLLGWRLGLIDGYDQPAYHRAHPSPDNR